MSNFLFGGEFEYENREDLEELINNLQPNVSLRILLVALNHASKEGAFDILESHCVHKCLENLEKNERKDSSIHNTDNNGDTN
jgi:hypothetical protein